MIKVSGETIDFALLMQISVLLSAESKILDTYLTIDRGQKNLSVNGAGFPMASSLVHAKQKEKTIIEINEIGTVVSCADIERK